MRHRFVVVLSMLMAVPALAADAYEATRALGRLNGVALQCKYLAEVQRMKAAMVANAPKERSFGLAFDQATNDAFLAFIAEGRRCPGQVEFAAEVDGAIGELQTAFGTR